MATRSENSDFQTFQQKRKMAKKYILIILSFPAEMRPDSPAPFMASRSFWTSASGLKPAASVTVPRVPICSENNNHIVCFPPPPHRPPISACLSFTVHNNYKLPTTYTPKYNHRKVVTTVNKLTAAIVGKVEIPKQVEEKKLKRKRIY